MFRSNDIDIILKILEDKINILDRKKERNMLLIIPKDSPIENLYITFKPIPLSLEKLTVFWSEIPIGSVKNNQKIYRAFKSLESEINYSGLILKRIAFIPRRELVKLSNKIQGLQIREDLCRYLNSDNDLLKRIAKIKPHRLEIKLGIKTELGEEIPKSVKVDKISELYEIASYYDPPENLYWNIVLEVYLVRGLTYPRKIFETYKILEDLGYKIIKFCSLLLKN